MNRCFLGLSLTEPTRSALAPLLGQLGELKDPHARIRPTVPANLHCTIKFLGNVDDAVVPGLVTALHELTARFPPFTAQLSGVDCFNAPRPRAVYAKVSAGHEHILVLSELLQACCVRLGMDDAHPNRTPHVTLARVSGAQLDNVVMPWVQRRPAHETYGPLDTSALILYKSETLPTGSQYTALHTLPFKT